MGHANIKGKKEERYRTRTSLCPTDHSASNGRCVPEMRALQIVESIKTCRRKDATASLGGQTR
jgi:hypothetical protein